MLGSYNICHSQDVWKQTRNNDGIKVFVKKRKDCNINDLKLKTEIRTTLNALMGLLADKESYPKWVYGCSEGKLLKAVSDTEVYHYQVTDSPWPLNDRDMVCHSIINQDPTTKTIQYLITSAPKYVKEHPDRIRVFNLKASWTFVPLENGMISAEYNLSVDPRGGLPAWVINLFIAEGPLQTVKKMKLRLPLYKDYQLDFVKF